MTRHFEGLLREALAPVEPPEDLVERLEGTLDEHHRAGRRRARGVGALGDARPAQLGAPGRGDRRRQRRRRRARAAARAPARAARAEPARRAPAALDRAAAERTLRDLEPRDAQAARRALSRATAARAPLARGRPPRAARRQLGSARHMATCYRHPSRETGVSCSNCGRPICPDCMTTTPVGMRCPECAKQRTKVMRMRDDGRRAARHLRADRDQRGRVPDRAGPVHAVRRRHPRQGHRRRRPRPRRRSPTGHEYWRLVSAGFLHENLLHIGFNMYLLYLLGHDARAGDRLGRASPPIYFTSLLAGSFGALLATGAPSLGASGAVFGLMGAAAVELRARRLERHGVGHRRADPDQPGLQLQLANISVGAHVGGLIGGALAGACPALRRRRSPRGARPARLPGAGAVAVAGSIAVVRASRRPGLRLSARVELDADELDRRRAWSGAGGVGEALGVQDVSRAAPGRRSAAGPGREK